MIATITPFPHNPETAPRDMPVPLDLVIAQHGAWRVLRAALAALLRRDRHPPPLLDDRMRRDIGLEPLPRRNLDWPLIRR
ncbi:hypothetical protein U879_10625 [Defluviimonas sp. 20V17]|uniref:DUF1127 domain-containing protein n=1 Tax=Allgaiera indica TaxID=765699 RepID=A0AAN4UP85_9RHOB|nr:hypothetical protein [Allgaiera indica]KDB03699.1 hypothetical protein U879_10625 [Defluviimonas sp. 20V17]GHD99840.1 hypothetical protein GCM10008024_09170 [Allgaiera indica]SDW42271.1 hypothetical protein SAMN05444006_103174 [Allgaiera indica]